MLEVDILVLTFCQRTSGYHFPGQYARQEKREGGRGGREGREGKEGGEGGRGKRG